MLIKDLVKSINGEYSAVICYSILAEKAPTAEIRRRIEHIREEEVRHMHAFFTVYVNYRKTVDAETDGALSAHIQRRTEGGVL